MGDEKRAGIEMDFRFGKSNKQGPSPDAGVPLRMLVIADFGGHSGQGEVRTGALLRPRRVNIESLPAVCTALAPRVRIGLGDQAPFTIAFGDLDDFHPDHLYASLDLFAPTRELRRQIENPQTFAAAAARLGVADQTATSPAAASAEGSSDIQRLLGRAPAAADKSTAPVSPASIVDSMIRQAVASHITAKADPRQAALLATFDQTSAGLMRALLHHPAFQSVEAVWRGLDFLVRSLEIEEDVELFVLDVSLEEMAAAFAASPPLEETDLFRLLADCDADAPWSLMVSLAPYQPTAGHAALLARLGAIAQVGGAALLAGMSWAAWTAGFAATADQQAWQALRSSACATSIGMALPRMLLRLPYGKKGEPIERFAFEEGPQAEQYLWGSGALACAALIGKSFGAAGGWDFSPGDIDSIEELAVPVVQQDGESVQMPSAEAWLPENKVDTIIREGFMPLVPTVGRGSVRLPRFQSIASPAAPLAGRWRSV
ncbi:MAG: type VI secretion system contractile sheath large subunit [Polyangia bacterium]